VHNIGVPTCNPHFVQLYARCVLPDLTPRLAANTHVPLHPWLVLHADAIMLALDEEIAAAATTVAAHAKSRGADAKGDTKADAKWQRPWSVDHLCAVKTDVEALVKLKKPPSGSASGSASGGASGIGDSNAPAYGSALSGAGDKRGAGAAPASATAPPPKRQKPDK
jgi:hypothetical protein